MNDPRAALHAAVAEWLRVRANVRRLATRLAAAEFALQRDARRSDDPQMLLLVERLRVERRASDALGAALDDRIASIQRAGAAIEAHYVDALVVAARSTLSRNLD